MILGHQPLRTLIAWIITFAVGIYAFNHFDQITLTVAAVLDWASATITHLAGQASTTAPHTAQHVATRG